jgi:hypothetical protein
MPFGPPPAAPPRSLRSASREGAPPAEPAGSPRDYPPEAPKASKVSRV